MVIIMNILYIAHERNMGGASKCLLDLACGMKERGHHVIVIVPIRNCNVQKELEQHGIAVFPVFFLWWEYPEYWKWYMKIPFRIAYHMEYIAVKRIALIIRRYHIDVVHSNSSVIDVGMRAAVLENVRHVWHFREFGDLDYQLEFFMGKKNSLNMLNCSGSNVIYISERVRQHYLSYIDDTFTDVVYDGIDTGYECEKKKEPAETVVFLVAGYLHRNKRQNLVIEAAHLLLRDGITSFEIWIAGKSSAMRDSIDYAAELRKSASDIPEHVKFLGFVRDMAVLRQKTDVEIVPSAEEAFGRVTVEAMMAQMPVIASDSGANPELIEEGKDGFLFESGSALQLARQMKYVIQHKEWIRRMGTAGQKKAVQRFSLQRNLDQIEAIYRKVL